MSTTSLPNYIAPTFSRTPSYTAEPQEYEQRIALNRARPSSDFVKQNKQNGFSLRLVAQGENGLLPVYGCAATVDGYVDVIKPDGVTAVEVKIEGSLKLKEIAEGGTTTYKLALTRTTLWSKDRQSGPCPTSIPFSLTIPTTFTDGKDTYPLPPTHQVHLSGVPGFTANVDYIVKAYVLKGKATQLLQQAMKNNSVSTPFVYYPRSRPGVRLPQPLVPTNVAPGLIEHPNWQCFETVMPAKSGNVTDVLVKFYIPASRVFCMTEPIPFHLTFTSSAYTLAAFLPYAPSSNPTARRWTRVEMLRQSTVDVRNAVILGTKTDIWRVTKIGESNFRRVNDGHDFIHFSGELTLDGSVRVAGFKAGGLYIKDCIVVSMAPEDIGRTPFGELRCVVPVRLCTDSYNSDGNVAPEYSAPSTPEEPHFDDYKESSS